MHPRFSAVHVFFSLALSVVTSAGRAQSDTPGVALVRHAPAVNGTISGSVQQMMPTGVALNGSAIITGDLLVPGTPTLQFNGNPSFGGTLPGTGSAAPTDYTIVLNGRARLGGLRTRTNAIDLPRVEPPPPPPGTRTVVINSSGDRAGSFATIRNLTLNGNVGPVAIPPGAYGNFSANGRTGFTLGTAGALRPAIYSFQHLTLNGDGELRVVGPVVVTLANGFVASGKLGAQANPEWLFVRAAAGDFRLDRSVTFYGYVTAPNGTVTLDGTSQLIGGLSCDQLVVAAGSTLRLVDLPPTVVLTAPFNGAVFTAPASQLVLAATASDRDGAIAKVEFFAGATKLAESFAAPYKFVWPNVAAGTYALSATATDNADASATTIPVNVIINAPPTVSLTQPANNAVVAAPGSLTLEAAAADSDGSIVKVEFFQGSTRAGEAVGPTYQWPISGLAPGTYTFAAKATDNHGATTFSLPATVVVDTLPVTSVAAPPAVAIGSGVTLLASATDDDGTVSKVEFYRNSVLIGTVTAPSSPGAYSFTDTATLFPGNYVYRVRTYDNWGLGVDSTAVVVHLLPTLPYIADFEAAEGYVLGPLSGQLGWTVGQGAVSVTDQSFSAGARSVVLPPGSLPAQIAQTFAPLTGRNIIFVDFFARPVAEAGVADSTRFDVEGARFALQRANATGVLQAFNGSGSGGGQWMATNFAVPITADAQAQSWVRLTARLDFAHKSWDLFAGGNMVAADLGFRDATATYLTSFAIRGHATTATRLDDLLAGPDNPLFVDLNNNGIDDAWETAHGLLLTSNNRAASPAGNGITVIQAYVSGTDPNDYYNGTLPVLTSLVTNGQTGADGLVAVKISRAADGAVLANAPVTLAVTTGASQIAGAVGGATGTQVAVRTDASGVARGYLVFTGSSDILVATAQSGTQTATLSVAVTAPSALVVELSATVTISGGAPVVTLSATATGSNAGISRVEFYEGATRIGESVQAPYSFAWSGMAPGTYSLTAKASDSLGSSATSSPISVTVPDISLPQIISFLDPTGALGEDDTLSLRVIDGTGAPVANASVTFNAVDGGHLLSATAVGPPSRTVTVQTGSDGVAKVYVFGGAYYP